MKSYLVPPSDVSFNDDLFGNNRPFEASTTKSSLQMRARRSPRLGSSPISINSHIRGRRFYWFTTPWNLTVNNLSPNTINSTVEIIANHLGGGGKSKSVSRSINLGPGGNFQATISPPNEGFSNMIMDSSTNPDLNFQVSYSNNSNGGSFTNINISFDWGGIHGDFSSNQPLLTTTTRTLSTWGTNRGVNVTVEIFDDELI